MHYQLALDTHLRAAGMQGCLLLQGLLQQHLVLLVHCHVLKAAAQTTWQQAAGSIGCSGMGAQVLIF
jgi:hypothetical protein